MSKRAEELALKAYPKEDGKIWPSAFGTIEFDRNAAERGGFQAGYEQAEKDIIEHCEKRIAEYNAQNLSNMFLRRAFEDVIRFIKEIPYNDYEEDEI